MVFLREEEEQQDPGTDVVLVSTCKQMIQQYCYDIPAEQYLSCLKVGLCAFSPDLHYYVFLLHVYSSNDMKRIQCPNFVCDVKSE